MINLDGLNDDEKLAALESIHKSIAESKELQKKKITTNVELIVKALKKIEADLQQRYDETGNLIANLKSGEDGKDGRDGKDGKDGRAGKDGAIGPRGYDGLPGRNGLDGKDGVSITDAHIDFDGSLIISLSTGRVINVGEVVTADIAEKIKVITNGGGTSQYVLDTLASLQAQISGITSGLSYKGTWNANTNTPTLTSSVGTNGFYYIVSVAGSTNLNGVTDWQVGDWAVFNGTVWQKLDQTDIVTSVAGRTGAIVLTTADIGGLGTIATQAASAVAITGGSINGTTVGASTASTGAFTTLSASSTATLSALTASTALALDASKNIVSVTNTGTGSNVLATSPTLVTPALGTPSSATLTNATGLPLTTGVTGSLPIANGGTGQSTAAAAITALTGTQTSGYYLRSNGTNASLSAIQAADVPTLNQNTTGTAANVTGTVAVANGGTGQTTANAAFNALAPSQTSNSGKYLTTDGTNTSWATNASGTVTSVAASVPTFLSVSGSPITTSGTLAITLSGTALPTANGGTGLTSFTTNGVAYATSTSALTTSSALTFDGANIGLGVTLSSWSSNYRAIQLGDSTSSGAIYQSISGGTLSIASNEYISATGPRYINTAPANRFLVGSGIHSWYTAASGTAGTAISYTQAMTLDASGNLFINNLTASKVVFTDASKNLTSTGTVAIAQGGTGTATPALVAGTNVTITGTWPNQTINSSNTGGTVTSVAATVPSFLSITGSPITTSGTLAITLSGTALPTTSGGTGLTSFTANGVAYASSSSALATGSALTFDGTDLATTGGVRLNNSQYYYGKSAAGSAVRLLGVNSGNVNYIGAIDSGPTEVNYGAASTITAQYWNISGTEQMRLTSTGLGIGTSSPAYKLDVANATYARLTTTTYSNGGFINARTALSGGTFNTYDFVEGSTTTAYLRNYGSIYGASVDNHLRLWNTQAAPITFGTSDTERMRLDSSGNLGLGVTPSAWSGFTSFDVGTYGSFYTSGGFASTGLGSNAYYNGTNWIYKTSAPACRFDTDLNKGFAWYNASTGTAGNAITFTQAMTLDASGNLGVGTTSPSHRIHVATTSGNAYMRVERASLTTGQTGLQIGGGTSSTDWLIYMPSSSNDLAFFGNSGERARFDTSGNFKLNGGYMSFNNNGYIRADISNSLALQSGSSTTIGWQVKTSDNATTKLSMSGTGGTSLALEGATPVTGTGITFPATQAASSDANTLDDYEEGTFTPTISFGGGTTGITYTAQNGTYVKVGKLVFVRVGMYLSNKGSSTGNVTISGLPFTSVSQSYSDPSGVLNGLNFTGLTAGVNALVTNNSSTFVLQAPSTIGAVAVTNSNFTNTTEFYGSFCYVATA